jgi:hypothetical protein
MRPRSLIAAVALMVLTTAHAAHAERWVVVNGARLSVPQIEYLESVRCGPIPTGSYWLDTASGIWGFAGDPRPQGHIRDNCYNPGRRPSLSERGMLFSPRDFID